MANPTSASDERAAVTTALLEATAKLVAQSDALALIKSMCEGLVAATPHIRLAWAWFGHPDTREIRPLVAAGPAKAYAEKLVIERNLLTSMGPAFRALRNEVVDHAAVSRFSLYGPWRAASKAHGFEVAVAFPLHIPNARKRGILVFYADNADYFERVGQQPFAAFARLAEATLAQAELRGQLHREATHDALTGLHNRAWLTEELERVHVPIELHAGFGVAAYPDAAGSVDDLLRAADAALYVAKRGGGNRVAAAPHLPVPA